MGNQDNAKKPFWKSLTGYITMATGFIAAVTGLITLLKDLGMMAAIFGTVANIQLAKSAKDICGSDEPCYVICESAFSREDQAIEKAQELETNGYKNKAGFFHLPDFNYFRNINMYQVYIGPFTDLKEAQLALCKYDAESTTGDPYYGVKIHTVDSMRCDFWCHRELECEMVNR